MTTKAAPRAKTNGHAAKPTAEQRIQALEERLATVQSDLYTTVYLHAELSYALKLAAATQLAQKLQPQLQQTIMDRLLNPGGVGA